jgi:serine/threonine protein kinase
VSPFVTEINSINSVFNNLEKIGKGAYAVVYSGVYKNTSKKVIIKTLKLNYFNKFNKVEKLMVRN